MRTLAVALASIGLAACIETTLNEQPDLDDPDAGDTDDGGVSGDVDPWPPGTPLGGVRGTICETAERGLRGVQVLIEHEYGVASAFTNDDGDYVLTDVPAGEWVLVAIGDDYFAQIPVLVPENEVAEIVHPECDAVCDIPVPCVGLAEAIDRGGARLRFDDMLYVDNVSDDLDICMDPWMVAFSQASQDLVFGQAPPVRIGPGQAASYPYSVDVYGGLGERAWWCVERWQYIAPSTTYTYDGSLAPDRLMDLIVDRTDLNLNMVEDHVDAFDGQLQTQHNIWNTEAEHPIFLVGRERSLIRLAGPGSRPRVTVRVRNLGQVAGTARITEVIPPGFVVGGISPAGQTRTVAGGATEITWEVELEGALPDRTYVTSTRYDEAYLSYHVSLGRDPCEGRCVGNGVGATWADADGRPWTSASEPLIIEHCTGP